MIQARIAKLIGDPDKRRRFFRFTLAVVVFGSLILAVSAGLDAEVRAPLFALIAATGLAGTLGARADGPLERNLKWITMLVAVGASVASALQWLLNTDPGTTVVFAGIALAGLS